MHHPLFFILIVFLYLAIIITFITLFWRMASALVQMKGHLADIAAELRALSSQLREGRK